MTKVFDNAELLIKSIVAVKNEEECKTFLEDLMTANEIIDLSQRILVAKLLKEKKSYVDIGAATGASTATISRVNRCLAYGNGGYDMILDKIESDKKQ